MKVLLLFFSVYLLALGCMPCADTECTGNGTIIRAEATNDSKCHGDETCPPFCTCACCSTHIMAAPLETLPSFLPLQVASSSKVSWHQQLLCLGTFSGIWQPPRLV